MRWKLSLAAAIALICAVNAAAQFSTPRLAVVDLYRKHNAKRSPFWQTTSRARVDRYFTKQLADLIWKDAHGPKDEAPLLDGDPLYDAQDTQIRRFKIGSATVKGDLAIVHVTFSNFSKKRDIRFALMRIGRAWKISNIFYERGGSLMEWLTAPAN